MTQTKSFTDVSIKSAAKGTVSAAFSRFNVVDLDGDVTIPGAIKAGTSVIISAYQHGSWQGALPVGKGRIRTTSTEAILEGQFFLDTTAGRDTFNVVKALAEEGLGEWSFSLHNVKSHYGEFDGQRVQFLESIDVHEVSPVLRGAGIGTRTLAAKSANEVPEDIRTLAAEHRLRQQVAAFNAKYNKEIS